MGHCRTSGAAKLRRIGPFTDNGVNLAQQLVGRETANAACVCFPSSAEREISLQPFLRAPRPCRLMDSIGLRLGDLLDRWPFR
ncbi:MAG: hypothetical protein C0429_06785 [Sphingopyxis sp.]|nr:hypothetical protein [Sphingopyxis sp.]